MAELQVGDRVSIDTKKIGQVRRSGVVTGVSQGLSGVRYTVAWDTGTSSVFSPGMGNLIKESGSRGSKAKPKQTAKASKTKTSKTKANAKAKVKAEVKAKSAKAKSTSGSKAKAAPKSKSAPKPKSGAKAKKSKR